MSYIVKNCPCYWHIGEDEGCDLDNTKACEDIADCVIKQVIDRCLAVRDKYCYAEKFNPRWQDANEILNMFETEGINE